MWNVLADWAGVNDACLIERTSDADGLIEFKSKTCPLYEIIYIHFKQPTRDGRGPPLLWRLRYSSLLSFPVTLFVSRLS